MNQKQSSLSCIRWVPGFNLTPLWSLPIQVPHNFRQSYTDIRKRARCSSSEFSAELYIPVGTWELCL
jgi:hypothetical protein